MTSLRSLISKPYWVCKSSLTSILPLENNICIFSSFFPVLLVDQGKNAAHLRAWHIHAGTPSNPKPNGLSFNHHMTQRPIQSIQHNESTSQYSTTNLYNCREIQPGLSPLLIGYISIQSGKVTEFSTYQNSNWL